MFNPSTATNAQLYEAGDYTRLIRERCDGSIEYFGALGVIGRTKEALDGLQPHVENPLARFYLGVSCWMAGQEKLAASTLSTVNSAWALELLRLMIRTEINVMALSIGERSNIAHGAGFLCTLRNHSRFAGCAINTVGEFPVIAAYADIRDYFARLNPPDFFICREVEWHLLPPNLQDLPCPIFGHTFDFDIHIQTCSQWFGLFDELIVSNHIEGDDLRRLTGGAVSTYPRCYGAAQIFERGDERERDIDLFVSGNMLHPYQPDKGEILHQLLNLPENEVKVRIEPFLEIDEYRELMARSKVIVAYVRRGGALATRALEALQMGCAVVVQDSGVLPLYMGEDEGVFTYSPEKGDLAAVIKRIVREWPRIRHCVEAGRQKVLREFSMHHVADRYLRYLTFRAAKPRPKRKLIPREALIQRRLVLYLGPTVPRGVYGQIISKSLPLWRKQLETTPNAGWFINMTRELVLAYTDTVHPEAARRQFETPQKRAAAHDPRLLADALAIYSRGLSDFPDSLVLLFNFVRVGLHFGDKSVVQSSLDTLESVLGRSASEWQIEPGHDVFPWDFYGEMFNYRAYFDELVNVQSGDKFVPSRLITLILASLNYYLSFYREELVHAGRAAALDPDFAAYTYRYSRLLCERGGSDDVRDAGNLLIKLAESSILYDAAWDELDRLSKSGKFEHPRLEALRSKMDLARKRTASLQETHETLARPVSLQPVR